MTNDPDVVLQTLPNDAAMNDTSLNSPGFVSPLGGEIVNAKVKNLKQVKRYQVDSKDD